MALIDIKVPDIGDFKDVAVIELLVAPGDSVKPEQSLISVESDKASMEIPSSHAGVVKEVKVKVGDVVNEGSVFVSLEVEAVAGPPSPQPSPAGAGEGAGRSDSLPLPLPLAGEGRVEGGGAAASIASTHTGPVDTECDLIVLGAGPGGYSAAFRAADLGMKVVLIERFATLGGVCLNVGCIPSKALLHVAAVMDEVKHFDAMGVTFAAPVLDLAKLRTHKEKVIGKLTGGLAAMAKMRKVTVLQGTGEFLDPFHL